MPLTLDWVFSTSSDPVIHLRAQSSIAPFEGELGVRLSARMCREQPKPQQPSDVDDAPLAELVEPAAEHFKASAGKGVVP